MFLSAVKDIRYKRSFGATGLQSGTRTVDEFVTIIDISDKLDPHAETEGLRQLRTREGQAVNALGNGRFKIVQTREILIAANADV